MGRLMDTERGKEEACRAERKGRENARVLVNMRTVRTARK